MLQLIVGKVYKKYKTSVQERNVRCGAFMQFIQEDKTQVRTKTSILCERIVIL